MRVLEKNKIMLLGVAPFICISMLILIPVLTNVFGKTTGYIVGFAIYWIVFCFPATLFVVNGVNGLKEIYTLKTSIPTTHRMLYYAFAFIPCLATLVVVFIKIAPIAGAEVLLIALAFAAVNGTFEEMFWRGAFTKVFESNMLLAYVYPSIFFGIWHIALYYANGIEYQGGFASLVGGALFMGLLWGWVAYKTKSIRAVTVAHIIANFFAFTGLIYENWFI